MSDLLSAEVILRVFDSVSTLPSDLTSASYEVSTFQQLQITNETREGPFVLLAGDIDKPLPSQLPFAPYDGVFFLETDRSIRVNVNGQGPQIASPPGFLTFAAVNTVALSNDIIAPGDTAPKDATIRYFTARLSPSSGLVPLSGTGGTTLSNVRVPDANGVETILYVRLSGNDATGDGSLTKPFLTLSRALSEIPNFIRNTRWIVDMTGMGTVQVGAGVRFPSFVSTDAMRVNNAATSYQDKTKGAVTVRSQMTNVTSITAPELTSSTMNATTGMLTLVTTKNLTVNQYKGKIVTGLVGGVPTAYAIVSNTAGPNSSIVIAGMAVPTLPLSVVQQSTTLSCDSGAKCVIVDTLNAPVVFSGLGFVNPGLDESSVSVRNASNVEINMASLGGFSSENSTLAVNASQVTVRADYVDNVKVSTETCLYSDVIFGCGGVNDEIDYRITYVQESLPVGSPLSNSKRTMTGLLSMEFVDVSLGDGDGILVDAGTADLSSVDSHGNTGNGVTVKSNAFAYLNGVRSQGGVNTQFGLQVADGAQVRVSTSTDVAGTGGQVKLGNNAAITWATFRTGSAPYSSTDVDDFSRVFQTV